MKKSSKARVVPKKKLQAIQTSRHLHVSHRKHTGHILPRRSTSYPVLVMIVLCVGVLLYSWTRVVTADTASYAVHASVPGPAPVTAASIESPLDGSRFSATPITVSGSCPLSTYVNVLRNGFSGGIALCSASGTFSLQTDLFVGVNNLVARDYSFTDIPGPDSSIVSVTYTPPKNSSPSDSTNKSTASTAPYSPSNSSLPEPLLLKANFTMLGYYVGDTANWQIRVEGGTAPYAVLVDWGDGSHQLFSVTQASWLSPQHVYKQPGGYKGGYIVKVTTTDSAGGHSVLQLVAIVTARSKTVYGVGSTTDNTSSSSGMLSSDELGKLVKYTWTGYAIILLMLTSFWLGERREFGSLVGRTKIRSHRRRHA